MRNDDDEINPFSREATTQRASRDVQSPPPQPVKPPPQRPRGRNLFACIIPIAIVVILAPVICCGGVLWWGFNAMSEPVDAAVVALESDDQIAAKLGRPIQRTSNFGVNEYQIENGEGSADVELDVEGTKGAARVSGKMKLFAGVWSAEDLTITCEDGTEFKLPATNAVEP